MSTGTLSVGEHTVTASVTDNGGLANQDSIAVTVTDVTSGPVGPIGDADGTNDTVNENAANGSTVGVTASADDPDAGDTVSYGLDDSAGGRFGIGAGSGVVIVANSSLLDLRNSDQSCDHGASDFDRYVVQHPDIRHRSTRRHQ